MSNTGIWGPILEEGENYVRDLLNGSNQTLGEWVNSGTPESITGKVDQASYRMACRRWARGEGRQDKRTDSFYSEVCKEYLDDIGEWPGDEGTAPQFTGGQCPGVNYQVFAVRIRSNGNGPPNDPPCSYTNDGEITVYFPVPGPIRGVTTRTENLSPGIDVTIYTLNHGGGSVDIGAFFTGCPEAGYSNFRVQRVDGLPDTCGNPGEQPTTRPELPSPMPPPGPPPKSPTGFNPNIEVNINIDGSIEVNIDGETGTIDPIPRPLPPPPPPGDQGQPGEGVDIGGGGAAEGEAPPGQVLVGLQIFITATPPDARQYSPGVYRSVGYFYMGGNSGLDQDYGGSMLRDGQFIYAENETCDRWRAKANLGYNLTVIPFYRKQEK